MSNKEWDGEGLPPVGVECEFKPNEWSEWKVVKVLFVGSEFAVFESGGGESVWSLRGIKVRPLPPQTKKIDMAKFAGSEFLMISLLHSELFLAKNGSFATSDYITDENAKPLYGHWNHWTGHKEPEWLEGFEYKVKEIHSHDSVSEVEEQNKAYVWKDVVAIKITGIKEGWKL